MYGVKVTDMFACSELNETLGIDDIHRVSEKNCANFFLLELCQISTNFGTLWQTDGKEAKIMQGALNFHLI